MKELGIEGGIRLRHPDQVGLVVTNWQKLNFTPVSVFVINSSAELPTQICLALLNKHYSLKSIRKTKEFLFCLPHFSQLKDVIFCGAKSGNKIDKEKFVDFKSFPGKKIQTPRIKNVVVGYECRFKDQYSTGNYTYIIGKILAAYTDNKDKKIYYFGKGHFKSL